MPSYIHVFFFKASLIAGGFSLRALCLLYSMSSSSSEDMCVEADGNRINRDSLYSDLSASLLGIERQILLCANGAFKGEPLIIVLVRPVFAYMCAGQVGAGGPRLLEVTTKWWPVKIQTPPPSCSGQPGNFDEFRPKTWAEWYELIGVAQGVLGHGQARVLVEDKSGNACGVETVRSVARKAICCDVVRAFIYSIVRRGCWSLSQNNGASVEMQKVMDSGRRQGMVQFLAELFVAYHTIFTQLLTDHFQKFPLNGATSVEDLLQNCLCSVSSPPSVRASKRPRDTLGEMLSLYGDVQELLSMSEVSADSTSDQVPISRYCSKVGMKLHYEVTRFMNKATKPSVAKRLRGYERGPEIVSTLQRFVEEGKADGFNQEGPTALSILVGQAGTKQASQQQ